MDDTTLVNFRMFNKQLADFDRTCALQRVNRTFALRELMRDHVKRVSASVPRQRKDEKEARTAVKNAIKTRLERRYANSGKRQTNESTALQTLAIAPFSSFLAGEVI